MTDELWSLTRVLALSASVGLVLGIVLRKLRPSWCKAYAKFCLSRRWWTYLLYAVMFGAAAAMSFVQARLYYAGVFIAFCILEVAAIFMVGIQAPEPQTARTEPDNKNETA
jgi:hypothetical protein